MHTTEWGTGKEAAAGGQIQLVIGVEVPIEDEIGCLNRLGATFSGGTSGGEVSSVFINLSEAPDVTGKLVVDLHWL